VPSVGTWLWFKARKLGRYGKAKCSHHVIQDMIVEVRQTARSDFKRDVSVTQVIGGTAERERIRAVHYGDGLSGCLNAQNLP